MAFRRARSSILAVALAGAVLGGLALRSWATSVTLWGGEVEGFGVRATLEPVDYDEDSGEASGTVRYVNYNYTIASVSPTFQILRIDPSTLEVTSATISCSSTRPDSNTVLWPAFAYTVPSGLKFYGVRVSGTFTDNLSNSHSLTFSIGGYTDSAEWE
jgi:hypothetical protein